MTAKPQDCEEVTFSGVSGGIWCQQLSRPSCALLTIRRTNPRECCGNFKLCQSWWKSRSALKWLDSQGHFINISQTIFHLVWFLILHLTISWYLFYLLPLWKEVIRVIACVCLCIYLCTSLLAKYLMNQWMGFIKTFKDNHYMLVCLNVFLDYSCLTFEVKLILDGHRKS